MLIQSACVRTDLYKSQIACFTALRVEHVVGFAKPPVGAVSPRRVLRRGSRLSPYARVAAGTGSHDSG